MKRRLVVKIGTNVICDNFGKPDINYINQLALDIATVQKKGLGTCLVASGAIGAGMEALGLTSRPSSIPLRQACASVGQGYLIHLFQRAFTKHNIRVGQVLVSKQTFMDPTTRTNMISAIDQLLELGACPIINENDVTATDEITDNFGDNDALSVSFAQTILATDLLILTSVDGVMNHGEVLQSLAISEIDRVEIKSQSGLGVGGMQSKLQAAKTAVTSGLRVAIAGGHIPQIIQNFLDSDDINTMITPS